MASVSDLWFKKILAALYGRAAVTRSELVEATSLNVGSVSLALKRLIANGVVQTVGKLQSTGGRKSDALRLNPDAAYFLVLDLQGLRNLIGFVNLAGDVRYRWDDLRASQPPSPAHIVDAVRSVLARLAPAERQRTIAIGASYTGLLDHTGALTAINLGWTGVHLGQELHRALRLPVFLDPDCFTKALVEHSLGAARGVKNWIYVSVEDGIGAGLYVDGRLLRGRDAMAGEFGHLTMEPESDVRCSCGRRGCLEALAATPAIVRQYNDRKGGSAEAVDISTVIERAHAADADARVVLDRAARCLGLGLAHLVNLLNPEMIVLGGSLSPAHALMMPVLREQMERHTLPALLANLAITTSSLGEDVALKGAASLAFRRAIEQREALHRICSPVMSAAPRRRHAHADQR